MNSIKELFNKIIRHLNIRVIIFKAKNTSINRYKIAESILILCSFFSLLFSLYLFFEVDKKLLGIFIGLWSIGIVNMINYLNSKFKN